MAGTAVVAIGGNALCRAGQAGTHDELMANAIDLARATAALASSGRRLVIVHGNGPQVGNLALQQDHAEVPGQPINALVAMTQGWLSSLLTLSLRAVGCTQPVVGLVTHVLVDAHDPAHLNPTKPIGPFYSAEQADRLTAERGWTCHEDAGRGYRRVIASPAPKRILEEEAVRHLLASGTIVITAGGGGIPVMESAEGLQPAECVVDKDHAACLMATCVDADTLVLLTGVDAVHVDFGTANQRALGDVTSDELRRHLEEGQFPAGSMGPKVSAALAFLDSGGTTAVITSPEALAEAMTPGNVVGTRVTSSRRLAALR
jgi:carbamate kinase